MNSVGVDPPHSRNPRPGVEEQCANSCPDIPRPTHCDDAVRQQCVAVEIGTPLRFRNGSSRHEPLRLRAGDITLLVHGIRFGRNGDTREQQVRRKLSVVSRALMTMSKQEWVRARWNSGSP